MSNTREVVTQKFNCPYCTQGKISPHNLLLHVINDHSENLTEFKEKYYSDMQSIYNHTRLHVYRISVYLSAIFIISGFLCFLAWKQSDFFGVIGWSWEDPSSYVNPKTFQSVIYALSAGAIGSISYSLWSLVDHYCRAKDFDTIWNVWYYIAPVIGGTVGIATYAVIVGGLFVLGDETPLTSHWSLFAFSYLTGFSTKKALRKLKTLSGKIFQDPENTTSTS
jgi:uncharacterized membrane protein